MSPLKESNTVSAAARPYWQYVHDMIADAERRMLPYPTGGNTYDDAYKALQLAVAPFDPSGFRAAVNPLITLYAIGVDEYPDELLEGEIEQLILAAVG